MLLLPHVGLVAIKFQCRCNMLLQETPIFRGLQVQQMGPGLPTNRLLPITYVILYRYCHPPTPDVGALEGNVEMPAHTTPIIGSKGSPAREANVESLLVSLVWLLSTCTVSAQQVQVTNYLILLIMSPQFDRQLIFASFASASHRLFLVATEHDSLQYGIVLHHQYVM